MHALYTFVLPHLSIRDYFNMQSNMKVQTNRANGGFASPEVQCLRARNAPIKTMGFIALGQFRSIPNCARTLTQPHLLGSFSLRSSASCRLSMTAFVTAAC